MMKCRICGSQGDHPTTVAREMMYGWGDAHTYFTCTACGCVQIEHVPDDLSRYYGEGYYSFRETQPADLPARIVGLRNRYAILRRGWVGAMLYKKMPTTSFEFLTPLHENLTLESTILDVGCGAGHLIRLLRQAGFRGAMGVDPFIERDIHDDGQPLVQRKSLDQVDGMFDVIMFHHSLEHVPDQHGALRAAHQRLNPGGFCIVRVPLSASYAWQEYGIHWVQLDAPRHLYLHSLESMSLLTKGCGFQPVRTYFDSTSFQFWGSEQYRQGIPLRDPRSYAVNPETTLFTAEQMTAFSVRAAELNAQQSGDQAVFILKREPGQAIMRNRNH